MKVGDKVVFMGWGLYEKSLAALGLVIGETYKVSKVNVFGIVLEGIIPYTLNIDRFKLVEEKEDMTHSMGYYFEPWSAVYDAIVEQEPEWFSSQAGTGKELAVKFIKERCKPAEKVDGKQFFGKKIKVNPETSELIQNAVFEAGGRWGGSGIQYVQFLQDTHFEINHKGIMWRCGWEDTDETFPELIVEVETTKRLKIVKEIPAKTQEQIERKNTVAKINELELQLASLKQSLEEYQ